VINITSNVTVPDSTPCAVLGLLSDGTTTCSHTNTTAQSSFSLDYGETIDLLEAQPARTCVPAGDGSLSVCATDQSMGTPVDMQARAGAVIIESTQYAANMIALESMCRDLQKYCTYQMVTFLKSQGYLK
jgi:hypothetical protein